MHPNEPEYLHQFFADWPISGWPQHLKLGRVLIVGSAEYTHTRDAGYAALFPGLQTVGVDLVARPGVDLICDMTGNCDELGGERFSAIVCASVMEHSTKPWRVAENIERHLLPDGLLYVTAPWVWRYHPYPVDFWRFSIDGIKSLFTLIHWKRCAYASQQLGVFHAADDHAATVNGQPGIVVTRMSCLIGRKVADV